MSQLSMAFAHVDLGSYLVHSQDSSLDLLVKVCVIPRSSIRMIGSLDLWFLLNALINWGICKGKLADMYISFVDNCIFELQFGVYRKQECICRLTCLQQKEYDWASLASRRVKACLCSYKALQNQNPTTMVVHWKLNSIPVPAWPCNASMT